MMEQERKYRPFVKSIAVLPPVDAILQRADFFSSRWRPSTALPKREVAKSADVDDEWLLAQTESRNIQSASATQPFLVAYI
jgi:hypothetical protein